MKDVCPLYSYIVNGRTTTTINIVQIFHVIPQNLAGGIQIDQWVAVLAFAYFGLKTLKVRQNQIRICMHGWQWRVASSFIHALKLSYIFSKDSYDMPDGDSSGIEEEKAEAEKAVEGSGAPEQKTPW